MGCEELLRCVERDYPALRVREGWKFAFRPTRTVLHEKLPNYDVDDNNFWKMQFLHEVGHALLGHRDWGTDLERVKMECAAWAKAEELCGEYGVEYVEDFAEDELDTYREWLHQRSRCRKCGLTRYQTRDGKYHCPQCELYGR